LGNYGELAEVWFDGGFTTELKSNITELFARLQPNAVAFQGPGKNAVRWAGTEGGVAPYPTWSTANNSLVPKGDPDATGFFPAVCDTTLQNGDQWAYACSLNRSCPSPRLRTLKQLIDVYHGSVGHNCGLELDFAPMNDGSMNISDKQRYKEFGDWIKACYDTPVATTTSGAKSITLDTKGAVVDRVVIKEDQSQGERVLQWSITAGAGEIVSNGTSVGNKIIMLLKEAKAYGELTLHITEAKAWPTAVTFAVHKPCADGSEEPETTLVI